MMAHTSSGAVRIGCPRCGANNFEGKTHCWQCGSSLPPPEAASAQAVQQPLSPVQYQQPSRSRPALFEQPSPTAAPRSRFVERWGMSPGVAAILAIVGVGVFFAVWTYGSRGEQTSVPLPEAPRSTAPALAPTQRDTARDTSSDTTDPLVAESKRFIERHGGVSDPPTSSDGRVHLRSGGSISPEQYRDAERHVQESPVLRTPIPAPPMP